MAIQTPPMTVEEFERFVELPENAELTFELIDGKPVEVPIDVYVSSISVRFIASIGSFIDRNGAVTGENGGYMIDGQPYVPNAAFISKSKLPLAKKGYHPLPPDLVVEIAPLKTKKEIQDLRAKIVHYLNAGVVVWAAFPETKTVEVHIAGQPVKMLGIDDEIDGGDVLPGFKLAVRDVFR